MPAFDASSIACRVRTYKEGVLSAIAHDLLLDAGQLQVDIESGRVSANIPVEALVVLGAVVNERLAASELSAANKAEIRDNMRKKVLDLRRHPTIGFTANGVTSADSIAGQLTINGATRPVTLRRVPGPGDGATLLRTSIDQRDFGIKPFKAAFGALKVKPRIDIEVEIGATAVDAVKTALGID